MRVLVLVGVRVLAPLCALIVGVSCGQLPSTAAPPPTPIVASRPAAATTAPPIPSAPRHDLSIDERRGGHTLERHVGRTDQQLHERLRREPDISAASTYETREIAERVIANAFDESSETLTQWAHRTGRRPNLVLERTESAPIGRSLRRNQRAPSACDHAIVVVRWDEQDRSSYVLTSYPECRR